MDGDSKVEALIENEREWRRHIMGEIGEIKQSQKDFLVLATTLKVKYGIMAGFFGSIGGAMSALIAYLVNK